MGLFKRLRGRSKGSIHELLRRTQDPVQLMNRQIREFELELTEAEAAFARQIAAEKRVRLRLDETFASIASRERDAVAALEGGDDSLAGTAFNEKKKYEQQAAALQSQLDAAAAGSGRLREQFQRMKLALDQVKRKRATLMDRAAAAGSKIRLNEAKGRLSNVAAESGEADRGKVE